MSIETIGHRNHDIHTASLDNFTQQASHVRLTTWVLCVLQDSFLVWVNKNRIGGFYGQLWGMIEHHLNFTYVAYQTRRFSLRMLLKLSFGF